MNLFPDPEELSNGTIAEEVGLEAISKLLTYYSQMLVGAFDVIYELNGLTRPEIKATLEKNLNLENILETCVGQITASNNVLLGVLQKAKGM